MEGSLWSTWSRHLHPHICLRDLLTYVSFSYSPLRRITRASFLMGVLVSMGGKHLLGIIRNETFADCTQQTFRIHIRIRHVRDLLR
jgi:hypothetical protein